MNMPLKRKYTRHPTAMPVLFDLQVSRDEGRHLSSEQAATEWKERFAAVFPAMH